jgi:hypothetical protein
MDLLVLNYAPGEKMTQIFEPTFQTIQSFHSWKIGVSNNIVPVFKACWNVAFKSIFEEVRLPRWILSFLEGR